MGSIKSENAIPGNSTRFDASDIEQMAQRVRANFINSLSGYKSANLIGTRSKEGIDNLAIVSSVFHVGAHPPLLGMIMRPHTVTRDTLQNIKETGVYTINHVQSTWVDKAHQTSARYDSEVSEFEKVGLTRQSSIELGAPYVKESRIKIGLQAQDIQLIPINNTELVIGQIVEVLIEDDCVQEDGFVDLSYSDSAVINGLDSYHSVNKLARYAYAKPDCQAEPLSLRRETSA